MAVVRVTADEPYVLAFEEDAYIEFASASPVGGAVADFRVLFNGELADRVHINVPHSWWKNAGQQIVPANPVVGDVLRLETDVDTDVRLDIQYPTRNG